MHESYVLYVAQDAYTLVAQSHDKPETLSVSRQSNSISIQRASLSLSLTHTEADYGNIHTQLVQSHPPAQTRNSSSTACLASSASSNVSPPSLPPARIPR